MMQQQHHQQQHQQQQNQRPSSLVKSFREKCSIIDQRKQIQRYNCSRGRRRPPQPLLRSTSSINNNISRISASIQFENKKSLSSRMLLQSSGTGDAARVNQKHEELLELEQYQSMPMQLQVIQPNTTPPSSPRAQHYEEEFHLLSLNSSPTTPPLNDDDNDDNDKAHPLSHSSSSPTDDCSTPSQDCASSYISSNLMNSQSSSSLSVLSPQSSQFATAAMEENIHRANEECAGLSKALSKFTKGSREYTMLKLKLDVAQDELACMKEDYDMFVNFASAVGDSGEGTMLHSNNNNNNDRSPLLQLEDTINTVERSPKLVVSGIPTPPLHTNNHPPFLVDKKSSHSCHGNFVSSSKEDGSKNTNDRQQQVVMDTKDLVMILESGVQKYSIEWFTIKSVMNQLSQMKEQSSISSSKIESMLEDSTRKISNDFIREDVKNELLSRLRQSCQVPLQPQQQQQQQQQISTIVENKFNSNNEIGMEALTIGKVTTTKARRRRRQHKKERTSAKEECNLTTLRLDEVPKYSLE
jgi:hypothetical protein